MTSQEAINAKARLAAQSQAWDNLTAAQRLAWLEWARSNPVVNRLGSQVTIGGNAAFVGINTRLVYAGDTPLTDPPIADPPVAPTSITLTCDIGPGTFDIAFTATPLAAGIKLWVRLTVLNNPAVNYVENLLRLLLASAAAQASPLDIQTDRPLRYPHRRPEGRGPGSQLRLRHGPAQCADPNRDPHRRHHALDQRLRPLLIPPGLPAPARPCRRRPSARATSTPAPRPPPSSCTVHELHVNI